MIKANIGNNMVQSSPNQMATAGGTRKPRDEPMALTA
jgi:hypothetical protein